MNYQSEMYGDAENNKESQIEGRTLMNAKVGYETENASIYLYSRNLTDEKYATQYTLDQQGKRELVRTGEPRFVGVQMDVNF